MGLNGKIIHVTEQEKKQLEVFYEDLALYVAKYPKEAFDLLVKYDLYPKTSQRAEILDSLLKNLDNKDFTEEVSANMQNKEYLGFVVTLTAAIITSIIAAAATTAAALIKRGDTKPLLIADLDAKSKKRLAQAMEVQALSNLASAKVQMEAKEKQNVIIAGSVFGIVVLGIIGYILKSK